MIKIQIIKRCLTPVILVALALSCSKGTTNNLNATMIIPLPDALTTFYSGEVKRDATKPCFDGAYSISGAGY